MTSLDAFKILIERIGKGESLEGTYNEFLLIKKDLEALESYREEVYKHLNIFFNAYTLEYLLYSLFIY